MYRADTVKQVERLGALKHSEHSPPPRGPTHSDSYYAARPTTQRLTAPSVPRMERPVPASPSVASAQRQPAPTRSRLPARAFHRLPFFPPSTLRPSTRARLAETRPALRVRPPSGLFARACTAPAPALGPRRPSIPAHRHAAPRPALRVPEHRDALRALSFGAAGARYP